MARRSANGSDLVLLMPVFFCPVFSFQPAIMRMVVFSISPQSVASSVLRLPFSLLSLFFSHWC